MTLSPDVIVQKIAPLDLDANSVHEVLVALARQQYPNDRDAFGKAIKTPWGEALLSKSVRSHRVEMQCMNATGNGATVAEILKSVRAVDVDRSRSASAGTGGMERGDNDAQNVRPQSHNRLNPAGSEPPNGSFEDSYDDAQKLSLAMKTDLLRYVKENPRVKYDDAVAHIYSKWHGLERAWKSGEITRFQNMGGARP